MIKKFLLTIGSRYLIALLTFVTVLLCANFLGTKGLGFASLFVLGIAMNQQLCNFLGGSALVYLSPRSNLTTLIIISYSGAIVIHLALIFVYVVLKPFDIDYFPEFFCISLMSAFTTINLSVMLGKEKVDQYNLISLFQVILQTSIFAFFAFNVEKLTITHYIIATGIGYFIALAGSTGVIVKMLPHRHESVFSTFREIVKYGFLSESGNLMQLFAYRLNYFLINRWLGLSSLGEFSLAIQLTESIRLFSKGIATVEYSHFSNTHSLERRVSITRKSITLSLVFTILGLLLLLLIPASFLQYIFGTEFHKTKQLMAFLAPGILFLSIGTIISPFFSGQGKHHINALGSAICFAVTALFSFLLIPNFGLTGAAIVNTLAYTAMTVYLYLTYRKNIVIS